jgi:hypothetical protein
MLKHEHNFCCECVITLGSNNKVKAWKKRHIRKVFWDSSTLSQVCESESNTPKSICASWNLLMYWIFRTMFRRSNYVQIGPSLNPCKDLEN